MLPRKSEILIVFIAIVISCAVISFYGVSESSEPTISIDTLLSAPEQVEIDGHRYVLETYLWRDFMPNCPPDGRPLIALIKISTADSSEFPSSIDTDRSWVIKDEKVWETKFSKEKVPPEFPGDHKLKKIARNGPKWSPEIQVDVVVRIIDTQNNKTYLLRALKQMIYRTD